jgi:hypothetical protein
MALNTLPNEGLTNRGYPSDRIVTPIIINGDMSVAQRGTSTSSATSSGYYACDRWDTNISSLGTWTISQSTDVPSGQGFANSMKWDCTTADASPSATDNLIIQQHIEGQNLQLLKKGTSSAEAVTYSFWIKSNKTGTYTVQLRDMDNSRHICKQFTISSADTWEKKILSFAGDTTGAFDDDNAKSLQVDIYLGAGSNFTSGTLASSWSSYTQANTCPGNVNLADSTSNELYLTGVQLEVGEFDSTSIPSFPFESFENNLRKCQRYYFCSDTVSSGTEFYSCFCSSSGSTADSIRFTAPVSFRSPDNVTITASAGTSQLVGGGYNATTTVPTFTRRALTNDVDGTTKPSGSGTKIYFVTNAIFTGISEGFAGFGTTGTLEFDNEL